MLIIFGTFDIEINGKSEHLCIMNDSKPGFHVMIINLTNILYHNIHVSDLKHKPPAFM